MQGERTYTSLEESLLILSRSIRTKTRREDVSVREAFGRVIAGDVVAKNDSPRWDVSHFDGFALVSADTTTATLDSPAVFLLRPGVTRLGLVPKRRLRRGEVMKILTGGYIPAGADAVVPVEDASEIGGELRVGRAVENGEHVYRAGSDVKKGELVLSAGRTLVGQDLVLLASLGFANVPVLVRPRVAIVPTGSELTSKIGGARGGRVVESHSLLLERLVEGAGGRARTFPIVPDDRRALSRALKVALSQSEVVLTLAGSSVGEPDLVESAILGLGNATTTLVHGVKVNRGRVMGFAVVGGKAVVILPGPIQGALNAFIVFGYPAIRYHLGKGLEQPPAVSATMGDDWEATGKFKDFDQVLYLSLTRDPASPGGLLAAPSTAETEKVSFLISKNAYALLSGTMRLARGELVQAHLLPGFSSFE